MLSRPSRATRNLITSSLYSLAAICSVAGVTYGAVTGNLTGIDLILTAVGTMLWVPAAGHGLYLRIQDKRQELAQPSETKESAESTVQKPSVSSTYARIRPLINPALNAEAAVFYAATDIYKLSRPTLPIVARFSGSTLWFICAVESFALELSKLTQQKQSNESSLTAHSMFGIKSSTWNILIDAKYLAAALSYAIAIYTEDSINYFKVGSNICWITANTIDLVQDIYSRCNDQEATVLSPTM